MPSWKKVIISGSDAALNSLNVTTNFTASNLNYPSTDGTSGQVITTDGAGNLSFADGGGGLGSTTKLNQTVAATTWSFNHNLGEKFPVVNVYDSNDEIIIPQKIDAIDSDNMLIYFSSARTGTAAAVVGGVAISASYALTASYIEGATNPFPYTGSAQITGSLTVTGFTTSTGGFTGSLFGSASYAVSASQALTASYSQNLQISGSINNVDYIDFKTSATATQPVAGRLSWNNTDGTLDLGMKGGNVTQQIGQETFYEIRNETTSSILNGTSLYANGVTAGSGRITAAPFVADGSIREVRYLGLATEDISTGVNGFVTYFGYVRGLDTRGTSPSSISVGDENWSVGDILYAHPTVAGKLTNIRPKHEIIVAIIIIRNQTSGVLFVRPSSYGHLDDIHDVNINTGSLSTGDLLIYDSGSGYWVNSKQLSGSYGLTGSLNATSFTGSLFGTASFAATSSYALNAGASFPYTGSAVITGSLTVTGSIIADSFIKSGSTGAYLLDNGNTSTALNSRVETNFIATANQTTFPLTYEVGQIEVYYNGSKLYPDEFIATNGTTVVLVTPATLDAQISIVKYVASFTTTAIRNETTFTTTAGQTTFNVNYAVGQVDVFYNGSKLNSSEFTATNGTSIILDFACEANESIVIVSYVNQVSGASGTTNRVAKFTGAASLGDSQIFDNGTNVGIGKDTPNAKLDVNGNTIITGSLTVTQPITGSLSGTATTASFVNVAGLGGFVQGGNSFGTQALIGTNDNQSLALETSGSIRMFVSSSGNVGVGTITPTTRLTVQGGYANFTDGTINIYAGSDGTGGLFGTITNHYQRFITNNVERMRIFSSGNVFIGSSSTDSGFRLDVDGTGRFATSLTVGAGSLAGRLSVRGTTNDSSAYSFEAANSSGNSLFLVRNDGNVGINTVPTSRLDIGNGTLTAPTLRGRTYTLSNVSSQNPNLVNGTEFNSIPVRVGDIIDFPFGQTRTVTNVTDTQLTLNANWSISFAGSNVEGRGGIVFEANNTERMRITAGGNVGIGTTDPTHLLHVMLPSGQNGQIIRLSRSAGSYTWGLGTDSTFSNFNFYNDGGAIVAHINPSNGVYTAVSDKRLKKNISNSESAIEKILEIKVRKFNWKNADIKEDYGFIAQELHEVLPQYVHQGNEETNWGVAKAELVPILVKAIQEQQSQIQEQQTLIQSLTDRLSALENK